MINYRKTAINTIDNLINKTSTILANRQSTRLNKIIKFITINLQLLKNDMILILNQNFYFRCKLDEKMNEIDCKQRKLNQQICHMQLSVQMLKQRYEKQIQNLKFNIFYHNNKYEDGSLGKSMVNEFKAIIIDKDIQSYKKQQNKQQNQIVNTIKKQRDIREFKMTHLTKQKIFQKQSKDKQNYKQDQVDIDKFDLQFRGGLVSQEQTIHTHNKVTEEFIHSEESHAKKKKARIVHGKKEENVIQGHRKKKSEQLAELVAEQFKVNPIKQQYFSTELL